MLEQFFALEKEATPGPWGWLNLGQWGLFATRDKRPAIIHTSSHNHTPYLSTCNSDGLLEHLTGQHPDAQFIAASRNLAPDIIRKLQAQNKEMKEYLEDIKNEPEGTRFSFQQHAEEALAAVERIENDN